MELPRAREPRVPPVVTEPRKHHYVPAFYLAGFTPSGEREDFLWVHDLQQQGRKWRARPDNAAHERDYYRIEQEGVPANAVEQAFGIFEGQAATALESIATTRAVPRGENLATALNFVALQIVRVPTFRAMIERNMVELSKWQMKMVFGDPRAFEFVMQDMRKKGSKLPDGITWEQMRDYVFDESRYTVEINRGSTLGTLLDVSKSVLPVLAARQWSLVVANDDAPDFVTTDSPVSLVATTPDAPPFIGFGLRCTEVSVPLTRRVALVGNFDQEPAVIEADRILVGLANRQLIAQAERFVFSRTEEVVLSVPRE